MPSFQHNPVYVKVALMNLLIALSMGIILRLAFMYPVPFNFSNLLHAHSHIASLGWIYLALTVFLALHYTDGFDRRFKQIFWLTQISVIGMMISFPLQGYGAVSISFAVLQIVSSYLFAAWFWRKMNPATLAETLLLKSALLFMLLSTIGIWLLGPSIVLSGKNTPLYHFCIQFYLHFQFEGFFILALLAIFIRSFKLPVPEHFRWFVVILIITTAGGLFSLLVHYLDLSFFRVPDWINNLIKTGIATAVIGYLFRYKKYIAEKSSGTSGMFLLLTLVFLLAKMIVPVVLLIGNFAQELWSVRGLVVGYVHLSLLGVISTGLIALIYKFFQPSQKQTGVFMLYSAGVLIMVGMLFLQVIFSYAAAVSIAYSQPVLLASGALIFISVLLIFIRFSLTAKQN